MDILKVNSLNLNAHSSRIKNSYLKPTGIDEKSQKSTSITEISLKILKNSTMVVFSNLGFIYPNCESAISKTFVKIPGIKIKVLELAMELLDELYLWVENKQYTTSNKTHGLTTLK